jgi:hypothetical protein
VTSSRLPHVLAKELICLRRVLNSTRRLMRRRKTSPLANAPANDDEAQLKRALFKYAQDGWQAALAIARATYRVGDAETLVNPCATQTVTTEATSMRVERIVIVALIVQVIVITIVVVLWGRRPKQ